MKWTALILGGGGPVGEFQIGAIQVLAKHYNMFDMYVGVGCGSLNSAVLAQFNTLDEGAKKLITIWDNIKQTRDIFDVPTVGGDLAALAALSSEKGWARDSIYGNKLLKRSIQQHINWDILKTKANWATEITSLNDGQRYTVTNSNVLLAADINPLRSINFSLNSADEYFIGNSIYDLMTAGGCTPLMLPPVDLFGHRFVEGGVRNCTPFTLAVKAFQAVSDQGFDEAEFIVVNNYVNEPNFESQQQLDSGMEIIGRTIKMMTIEIAQNEMFRGKSDLEKMRIKSSVISIQPVKDFRLSPFNFNDMVTRLAIRNHGVTVAAQAMPAITAAPLASISSPVSLLTANVEELVRNFKNEPDNSEHADKLVSLTLADSTYTKGLLENHIPSSFNIIPMASGTLNSDIQTPANIDELIVCMKKAFDNNQRIKAVGAGFAFDDILQTDGMQISMANMRNIWNCDGSILKNVNQVNSLLEFEAGATIKELTNFLWIQNRALLNQPGYEGLSFVGVAMCGGHGSGIDLEPLAKAIVGLNLITFNSNGDLVQKRIEYTDGISDPAKFKLKYSNIELIQNDDYMKACTVSVGTMGIIHAVTVRTQSSFYLEETRKLQKWSELSGQIEGKLKDRSIHSIHIWFNPYFVKGEINCVLTEYRRVAPRANMGHRGIGVTFGLVPKLAPLILWCMEHFPDNLGVIMNSTLKATVDRQPYVMPCPEALNFGTPNLVSVDATNCGVPVDRIHDAAKSIFELAGTLHDQGKYMTCPVGFRFTSSTDAYLAPQNGRATCMIEMPLIKPTPGASEIIDQFLNMLINHFDGRPHWGQRLDSVVTPENLGTMYREVNSFRRILKEFNYKGVFDNEFTKKIGLS